jgi:multiple sugar transport system ATP-binding protein
VAQVILENVVKVYIGGITAVKGINLDVADKEFIVLVGPSGCGKSTTLRMVAGLEEISEGTIRIGERIVNDVPPKDRDIAMVFQNYALYPHMSVYKNMAFGLKLRKMKRAAIDKRVRKAAEILGIEELLERRPKALSGGQRQRVAVGRAIVRDPACFLFDEPLSNLDAKLRVETRAELKRLHKRLQTTTIYVTHDQEEAMTLGDRVVVMHDGEIQACDTPLNVYNKPPNRFVAGFVGTPPMNFIDGTISDTDGELFFESQSTKVLLGSHQKEFLADKVGEKVVFGVRPEGMHLRPGEGFSNKAQVLPVAVGVVEPLGSTMDVYCSLPEQSHMVARVQAEPLADGGQATFYLDMKKTYLFAPGERGVNLTRPAAEAATV